MSIRDELRAALATRDDEFVQLCAELIRQPAENPPGDTTAIHATIADYLTARAIPFETVAPQPHMPNIIATFEGATAGPHLVLNGHLDVFPAGDRDRWSVDPYGGVIRGDKLYGRGANDMRAGVTASLITYTTLYELRHQLCGRLTLTLVSDEEGFGPWGAQYLVENDPRVLGDAVLSGEGSGMETMLFGEKGLCWIELVVETLGGHSGMTHKSANAVKEAARIITQLEELAEIQPPANEIVLESLALGRETLDRTVGPGAADVMPRVTVSVGPIEGGEKVNMIANHCRAEVDVRWPPGLCWEDLRERFAEIVARSDHARWQVMKISETNVCDPSARIFQLVAENAEAVTGTRPVPALTLGGTDCRLWRWRDIPSVVYGPTNHNIGAPDECVLIPELVDVVTTHVLTAYDYLTDGATS